MILIKLLQGKKWNLSTSSHALTIKRHPSGASGHPKQRLVCWKCQSQVKQSEHEERKKIKRSTKSFVYCSQCGCNQLIWWWLVYWLKTSQSHKSQLMVHFKPNNGLDVKVMVLVTSIKIKLAKNYRCCACSNLSINLL